MAENIVLTFALLYGACIAVIAAVYVALDMKKKRLEAEKLEQSD